MCFVTHGCVYIIRLLSEQGFSVDEWPHCAARRRQVDTHVPDEWRPWTRERPDSLRRWFLYLSDVIQSTAASPFTLCEPLLARDQCFDRNISQIDQPLPFPSLITSSSAGDQVHPVCFKRPHVSFKSTRSKLNLLPCFAVVLDMTSSGV